MVEKRKHNYTFHDLCDKSYKSRDENNNQTVNEDANSSDSLIQTEETMKQTLETVKESGVFTHHNLIRDM